MLASVGGWAVHLGNVGKELSYIIENNHYPLSQRIRVLRSIGQSSRLRHANRHRPDRQHPKNAAPRERRALVGRATRGPDGAARSL